MLSEKMEYYKVRINSTPVSGIAYSFLVVEHTCRRQAVITMQQSVIILVSARVPYVKLLLGKLRVIEEKASREIINGLVSPRQKLIGQESDLIAGLAEQAL